MGRDFLKEFGPERRIGRGPEDGGDMTREQRDVMNYSPPKGPIGVMDTSPVGLGGKNLGNRGSQESRNVFGDGAGGMASNGHRCVVQGRY